MRILLTEYGCLPGHIPQPASAVNVDYLRGLLNDVASACSPVSITECYISHLFNVNHDEIESKIEASLLRETFYDCLICTLKYINVDLNPNSITENAKKTLNSLLRSFEHLYKQEYHDGEVSFFIRKNYFKSWVFDEFPDLFLGYHNWLMKRIEDNMFLNVIVSFWFLFFECFAWLAFLLKEDDQSKEIQQTDLSDFMNTTMVWYFCFNLPTVYIRNLAIEMNSQLEKLKNCLVH
jgi:hypothetical protein